MHLTVLGATGGTDRALLDQALAAGHKVTRPPPRGRPLARRAGLEPFVARVLGRTLYEDMRRMEELVRASDLGWTVARPSGLFDVPAPTDYTLSEDRSVSLYTARADLAAALLTAVTGEEWTRRVMAVSTTVAKPSILGLIWREGISRR